MAARPCVGRLRQQPLQVFGDYFFRLFGPYTAALRGIFFYAAYDVFLDRRAVGAGSVNFFCGRRFWGPMVAALCRRWVERRFHYSPQPLCLWRNGGLGDRSAIPQNLHRRQSVQARFVSTRVIRVCRGPNPGFNAPSFILDDSHSVPFDSGPPARQPLASTN